MDFQGTVKLLNSSIDTIKGIGKKKADSFNKIGIYTIWDLLYTFPRAYEDRTKFCPISELKADTNCCISAVVTSSVIEKKIKNKMSLYILRVADSTGYISIKWFSSPFNRQKIKRGQRYSFYGSITSNGSSKEMILKVMEHSDENKLIGKIVPVYRATNGITQNDILKAIDYVFSQLKDIPETLPDALIKTNNLMRLYDAVYAMHRPTSNEILSKGRYRFAFEELFILCLAMKRIRTLNSAKTNVHIENVKCVAEFAENLPFVLTKDQKNTVNEICIDLKKDVPMNRLIQGDVGSGKTVVAACGAYAVVKSGYQVALMAPTEILAVQHYETFSSFFKKFGITVTLLTSSTKNKGSIYRNIENGESHIVVGTHALLQNKVKFKKLGLCITDEQHRFGVKQRALFADDLNTPHILVMSATPIPRTLSMVIYGDLDISVISIVPQGRQKVDTFCIGQNMRDRLNNFITQQVSKGFQCFVVCPLIDSSENLDINSGTEIFQMLKETFPSYRIAFLHGKISSDEKDDIMLGFKNKEYDILVSTTVIEVGIDIPNANLMIIENAERFGLSQLHQLRGRVGRGKDKSYCILITDSISEQAKERMKIMCSTSDGFVIASEDMKMRGSGQFFGTRQHGLPELKVANLFTDMPIAVSARDACDTLLKQDPLLNADDNHCVRCRIESMLNQLENFRIFN